MFDVAIIGGGISGLACGYYLKHAGLKIAIIEGNHVGGAMRSQRMGPYLLEAGPNSLRGNSAELLQLIADLGLEDQLVHSSPLAKKRYIYRDGRLIATPTSPMGAITSPLIPFTEKIKLFRDAVVPRTTATDESIRDFITRRTSAWFADNIVDAMVTGIYAGDTEKLSMRSSFPSVWQYEQEHGSVLRGMGAPKRKPSTKNSPRRKGIFSFKGGLQTFIDALTAALKESIVEGLAVSRIEATEAGYHLVGPNIDAEQVIIASPAHNSADLLKPIDAELSSKLNAIEHPHVAVVSLAYKRSHILHPLDGFGYLVPSNQQRNILGCIFSSSLWPDRAPQDEALLTIMIGGSHHPEMREWSDEEVIGTTRREIAQTLQITYVPLFSHVTRWPRAIPQYHMGHHKIIEAIEAFEQSNPRLHLLSNYRGGIAIGNCVTNATELAKRLVQQHIQ